MKQKKRKPSYKKGIGRKKLSIRKPGVRKTGRQRKKRKAGIWKHIRRKWSRRFPGIENVWLDRAAILITVMVLVSAALLITGRVRRVFSSQAAHPEQLSSLKSDSDGVEILPAQDGPCGRPEIEKDYIEPNPYSRSQIELKKVKGIVIHYVANPGSTARDNRDYFENLMNTHATKASSHFVVGLKGEIIQCIPLDEISYASNQRNKDTISIECCHPGKDGKFNKATYDALVRLAAWLCDSYGLDSADVIRHYDVTGKLCPLYYVENEDAWVRLRKNIQKNLDNRNNH